MKKIKEIKLSEKAIKEIKKEKTEDEEEQEELENKFIDAPSDFKAKLFLEEEKEKNLEDKVGFQEKKEDKKEELIDEPKKLYDENSFYNKPKEQKTPERMHINLVNPLEINRQKPGKLDLIKPAGMNEINDNENMETRKYDINPIKDENRLPWEAEDKIRKYKPRI